MRIGAYISIVEVQPSRMISAIGQEDGPISRRTVSDIATKVTARGRRGAIPHAHFSAAAVPISGWSTRISPAIGKSTSRDQWMLYPPNAGSSR